MLLLIRLLFGKNLIWELEIIYKNFTQSCPDLSVKTRIELLVFFSTEESVSNDWNFNYFSLISSGVSLIEILKNHFW